MRLLAALIVTLVGLTVAVACSSAADRADRPDQANQPSPADTDSVSSSDPPAAAQPTPTVPEDKVKVLAPIESLEIAIAESFPPQYFAQVVVGLPNGCVEFFGSELSRSGNEIEVTVYNLAPAPDADVMCTERYGTHEQGIALGTEFESGELYTVSVNGVSESFTAQ